MIFIYPSKSGRDAEVRTGCRGELIMVEFQGGANFFAVVWP